MSKLKNTIKFAFSNGSEKPNIGEVANFVKCLDADSSQVEAAYRMSEERSLYVKFKSEESMVHALTFNSEELIFHYANGKKTKVYMSHVQEHFFYVRVYELPPDIPDQELVSVLEKYGKVKRVVREKFPVQLGLDAHTGVRGVYMDVKKEIPTSLHFHNRKGNIFYPGNKERCFLCKEEGHRVNACPKRKARNQSGKHPQEQKQSGSTSYAGVVSGDIGGGAGITVNAANGGEQSDNSHQQTRVMREEKMPEAAMAPAATENNEEETSVSTVNDYQNHPLIQLAQGIAVEINKRKKEVQKKKEEEEAKLKSPPRKKKNFSLYRK